MYLDIQTLGVGTTKITQTFEASQLDFEYRDYSLLGEWLISAEINKNSRSEVAIKGHIKGVVDVYCDRCLSTFDYPIENDFDICMIPGRLASGREIGLDEERMNENYYMDSVISLAAVLKEQIILNLPQKMLCSDDCAGLCTQCGADLNRSICDCNIETKDPRWDILLELKNKKSK